MKAEDTLLLHWLGGGQRQFVIPVFQRDYSWNEVQCRQLLNDVMRVASLPEDATHFIGSIVAVASSESGAVLPQWLVIDGQQRLTTCTILLTALRDRLATMQGLAISDSAEAIEQQYLRNPYASNSQKNRLALRGADDMCLRALLDRAEMPHGSSTRVTLNAAYFSEVLADIDPVDLLRGMRRLSVVSITLSPKYDNPQLIFESLNSTGLALTQADLVRNYVLMGHPEQRQTEWYEQYWRPLEASFGSNYRASFDTFLRDFLALELGLATPPRLDHVYREFRVWYPARMDTADELEIGRAKLEALRRFGQHYCTFMFDPGRAPVAAERLRRLKTLVDVAAPLVMVLLELWRSEQSITDAELLDALDLLESYVLRRSMVSADTRSGGKIFNSLAQKVRGERPSARLAALLARMPKGAEFPSDLSFTNALKTQDLYGRRYLKFMLDRLTNSGKEKVVTEDLTIEHILPQKDVLAEEWQQMLGPQWRETRDAHQHKLGNLTLTGFNSELQARPFAEKKNAPEWGYINSAVWLSRDVAKQETWGEAQITARSASLAERAAKIWKPLEADAAVVKQLALEEARARSQGYSVDSLKWPPGIRPLFDALREKVLQCADDVSELPRAKSVVYYSSEWFLEVLPRAKGFTIRLSADVEDLQDLSPAVQDTSAWLFVLNSTVTGGSLFHVLGEGDLEVAIELAKRSYEMSVS